MLSGQPAGSEVEYTRVNFDINGNNVFNDTVYEAGEFFNGLSPGSVFKCENNSVSTCDGDVYQVRFYNDRLFLYNASFTQRLNSRINTMRINDMNIKITFTNAYPEIDSISSDAVLAKDWNTTKLKDKYGVRIRNFIANNGIFIPIKNLSESDIDSFYGDLKLEWEDFPLSGSSKEYSEFINPQVGNKSYYVHKYFNNTPISLNSWDTIGDTDFEGYWDYNLTPDRLKKSNWIITGISSGRNEYLVSNITLSGNLYHALFTNTSSSTVYDQVYLSNDTNFTDEIPLEAGEVFTSPEAPENNYTIEKINPLQLVPHGNYTFANMRGSKVEGNDNVLVSTNRYYDTAGEDIGISTESGPSDSPPGVPETDCENKQNSSFQLKGRDTKVVLTDINLTTCDGQYNYVSFNFNPSEDNDFNDTREDTPPGYSEEGPYIRGEVAEINGSHYTITPVNNGNKLWINITSSERPSAIPASSEAVAGRGSVFVLPNRKFGTDEYDLIRSIIITEAMTGTDTFTVSETAEADVSVAVSWFGDLEGDVYVPYRLKTEWWYS